MGKLVRIYFGKVQVIMTSHNGAYTEEAIANMGIQAA